MLCYRNNESIFNPGVDGELEDCEYDDSSDEDEEEGGDGGGPPIVMLHQGLLCSQNNESIFNPGVDGGLEELLRSSVFRSPELWLSQLLVWGSLIWKHLKEPLSDPRNVVGITF